MSWTQTPHITEEIAHNPQEIANLLPPVVGKTFLSAIKEKDYKTAITILTMFL